MPRKSSTRRRSGCPISIALELLGDQWSLLIVRDLMFKGRKTFNEFQNAGEGIATNILADRLARLETSGILTKQPDDGDARRYTYRLTEKGIDLAPTLTELILWASTYENTEAPPTVLREIKERRRRFLDRARADWQAKQ
jgi:DNA-binding HxlR family transcriptional regulator